MVEGHQTEKNIGLVTKQMKAIAKANKKRWEVWRKQFREEAEQQFPVLKKNPLFVAGLMLYWGEGRRNSKKSVQLSNIDSKMIKLFRKFLLKTCGVAKNQIRLALTLYPDLSKEKCKKFWSKKTGVPLRQIEKPQVIYGRHPTKRLEYGICGIKVIASSGLNKKIMVWIGLLYEDSINV